MLTHMLCADREYTSWNLEEENYFFQKDGMNVNKQLEQILR